MQKTVKKKEVAMCLSRYNKFRHSLKLIKISIIYLDAILALFCVLPTHGIADYEEGICARVRLQLSQDVVIARNAFQATLEIANAPENVPLENLNVIFDISDENDQSANDLFGIHPPELSGVGDVNGTGVIQPGTSAIASWLLVPTRDAAPDGPVTYYVGGEFSYTQGESTISMPLFPAPILVRPEPLLVLDYFWEKDVYGDDPFTSEIEPSVPFALGLMVRNNGKDVADDFRIVSSQPRIIENEKGLLVDFRIIGAQVNADPVSPSLGVVLGDIDPGETSVVIWMMTSSLQGQFIDYDAVFTHIDGLGNPRLSLIDTVDIHELIHVVWVDGPGDDKPDFLANDVPDDDDMPDVIHSSEGAPLPVDLATEAFIDSAVQPEDMEIQLSAIAPSGWIYLRIDDPGGVLYRLAQVVRSDGKEIKIDYNAWTTHRVKRLTGQDPVNEDLLHLVDHDSTGGYTLYYEKKSEYPHIEVAPADIDFGHRDIAAGPTPSVSATITNNGDSDLVFSEAGIGIAGLHSDAFLFAEAPLTSPLASQDSRTVNVVFDPASAGEKNAEIVITTNDPYHPAVHVPLSGVGIVDSDEDGMADEWELLHFETLDRDGTLDWDGDELTDCGEYVCQTDPKDADTDDDGILDGVEEADEDGFMDPDETSPRDPDSDFDGVQDGTEKGLSLADVGEDTVLGVFQEDEDTSSRTDPRLSDTDGDTLADGQEDSNANGRIDPGETDPNHFDILIQSAAPACVARGEALTLTGINFGCHDQQIRTIRFAKNAEPEQVVLWSDNKITCVIPEDAVSGCVRIETDRGESNCYPVTVLDGEWVVRSSMPAARSHATAQAVGDKIYVLGGRIGDAPTALMERYDTVSDSWETEFAPGEPFAPAPMAVEGFASAVVGDEILVIGGQSESGISSEVYAYDTSNNTWRMADNLPEAVCDAKASVIGKDIYVFGGVSGEGPVFEYNDRVFAYDPEQDLWRNLLDMPETRHSYGLATIEDTVYIAGGVSGADSAHPEYAGDLLIADDPENGSYGRGSSMPEQRSDISCEPVSDFVYCTGGSTPEGSVGDETFVYSPEFDQWAGGPLLNYPRTRMASAQIDNTIYVFGGQDGAGQDVGHVESLAVAANHAPVAVADTAATDEDVSVDIALTGDDKDNESLTFRLVRQPSNGTLEGAAPDLSYTPAPNFNGEDSFAFVVNDGYSDSREATVTITVNPVNDPPTISGVPDQVADTGVPYFFQPDAEDIDEGETLVFSILNRPSWADFDPLTGALSGTPEENDAGVYEEIEISVSDQKGATASLPAFEINVNDLSDAPVVAIHPAVAVGKNSAVLGGSVNPNGSETTFEFEYWIYWDMKFSTGLQSLEAGAETIEVDAFLDGLAPDSWYTFQLIATNSQGTSESGFGRFKTLDESSENVCFIDANDYCGGHEPCYSVISEGIGDAIENQTVRVGCGLYLENVVLGKDVILEIGWDADFTTLDQSNPVVIWGPGTVLFKNGSTLENNGMWSEYDAIQEDYMPDPGQILAGDSFILSENAAVEKIKWHGWNTGEDLEAENDFTINFYNIVDHSVSSPPFYSYHAGSVGRMEISSSGSYMYFAGIPLIGLETNREYFLSIVNDANTPEDFTDGWVWWRTSEGLDDRHYSKQTFPSYQSGWRKSYMHDLSFELIGKDDLAP